HVQLPTWLSKGSYYFQTYAFKKASFVQIGFDATLSASYKARIYNPAIMQFQLSDQSVGAYPFIDFFIHAEVKTARIFFRIENLAADIPDEYATLNYYYTTPFYPGSPRRFRLGFNWKFYY
ncbi:MAG: TonB-dependent receptor, partial [Bacteroidetes bacterium]|nr:TonB-dependent receptor [Bacteroidota bacterium]